MKKLNFGRNITVAARSHYAPKSEREVLRILDEHRGQRIRCIGRLHSWSDLLVCDEVVIDLRHLNSVEVIGSGGTAVAKVGAGCQIKRLLTEVDKVELTLPSVGFVTEQSIAGAISTGTHGSGRNSLSHQVTCVRVARYDRDRGAAVIEEITSGDELLAARCSLGCLGIILRVTVKCREKYCVEEHFREYPSLAAIMDAETDYDLQQFYLVPWRWTFIAQHRREVQSSESRWSFVYRWYRHLTFDLAMHLWILFFVRVIRLPAATQLLFRRVLPLFVIRDWKCVADSNQQLVMEHELFRHVEAELFVQRDHLDGALRFLQQALREAANGTGQQRDADFSNQLREAGCDQEMDRLRGEYCHHYPICVRKILPDATLISMASSASCDSNVAEAEAVATPNETAWYSITLTNYHPQSKRQSFDDLVKLITKCMAHQYGARPHWGKLCFLSAEETRHLYPAMERFRRVCQDADPDAVFRNDWTQVLLNSSEEPAVTSSMFYEHVSSQT